MKISHFRQFRNQLSLSAPPADPLILQTLLREHGLDTENLYQELEMESRFVDTHRDISWSNDHMNLHSHNFMELLYCVNTCGAEYLVGTERYRLQKGDIIMVPPGISHRPLLPEHMAESYQRDVLWVSTEFLDTMRQQFPDDPISPLSGSMLLRTAGTKWEFLGELFRNGIRESEERNAAWHSMVISNTIQILVQIRRALLDHSTRLLTAEEPELLDRVLSYIEENLPSRITLADTAKRFYVSESTISHTFKEKMGTSFYRCITQRRLISAKTMILEGQSMDEIAANVGFGDYSSFYRAFKQEFGISPRQFRRMQDSGDHSREEAP